MNIQMPSKPYFAQEAPTFISAHTHKSKIGQIQNRLCLRKNHRHHLRILTSLWTSVSDIHLIVLIVWELLMKSMN